MGAFPQTAQVGKAYTVKTRSTGPIGQVTVWLDDALVGGSVTSAWSGTTPVGLLRDADVVLIPQRAGTFRLAAKALDYRGCERDRTGLSRLVTVKP